MFALSNIESLTVFLLVPQLFQVAFANQSQTSRGLQEKKGECAFNCFFDEECIPGLLCAVEHTAALAERGFSPTTADCDFLPQNLIACFNASLLDETAPIATTTAAVVPRTTRSVTAATSTLANTFSFNNRAKCESWIFGACSSTSECCDGLRCRQHNVWNRNVCLPDTSSCSVKHESCSSSSDCCREDVANICKFNAGYDQFVCMEGNECSVGLYKECNESDTCCGGLACHKYPDRESAVCVPPNETCSRNRERCDTVDDCCGESDSNACRFSLKPGANVCIGADECNTPLYGDCDASSLCCGGLTCRRHLSWNRNVCLQPLEISSFTLINSTSNEIIQTLGDGSIVEIEGKDMITVRADVPHANDDITGIRFSLDDDEGFRIEENAPYALFGDDDGDYHAFLLAPGPHTVTATILDTEVSYSVQLNIIDGASPAPSPAPTVAATQETTLQETVATTQDQTSFLMVAEDTETPTHLPTQLPTRMPFATMPPTFAPSSTPRTPPPTSFPTPVPTDGPTSLPTNVPTMMPTKMPFATRSPTDTPFAAPSGAPTFPPSRTPTFDPTSSPTHVPTNGPTPSPTNTPTSGPTQTLASGEVVTFALFDVANKRVVISDIRDGMTIYLPVDGEKFNILVTPVSSRPGTVEIGMSGADSYYRIERTAPYYLYGDSRREIFSYPLHEGPHTVWTKTERSREERTIDFNVEYSCSRGVRRC